MIRFRKVILLLSIVSSITFSECTYDHEENYPCYTIPDSVSFSLDVQPIFRAHCSIPLCHSGPVPTGNLNLEDSEAYDELQNPGSGYIKVSKPNHSILYSQLNSTSLPMPPEGKLDRCTIELILKWIEQGALNN